MTRYFIFTIDLESDVPGVYENSYFGIEEGLQDLRDFFRSEGIRPDLFMSAELTVKYAESLGSLTLDFNVGNHGYNHRILSNRSPSAQKEDIVKSTRIIESLTGQKVKQFRAPNFSVSGTTITILDNLGYVIDSSVLPGRKMTRFKLFKVYDFRNAPRTMYHPSRRDVAKKDGTRIVEIPLTENPALPGAPLGMGFLNKFGVDETIAAVQSVAEEYATFLIHSWEFTDLAKRQHHTSRDLADLCKKNPEGLSGILDFLARDWEIVSLLDLRNMWVREHPGEGIPRGRGI